MPSSETYIGSGRGPTPGGKKGVVRKTPWDHLQEGILELTQMPLQVLKDDKDRELFARKLREAALKNPPGYVVKVIIPLLKMLPQQVVVEVYGTIDTGDGANALAMQAAMRAVAAEDIELGRGLGDE